MIKRVMPFWKDGLSLFFALGDRRTPALSRILTVVALVYAVSPIDLLPDITPVLGIADDVLLVPTLLALAARSLPEPVLLNARSRRRRLQQRLPWLLPLSTLLLLTVLGLLIWGLMQWLRRVG